MLNNVYIQYPCVIHCNAYQMYSYIFFGLSRAYTVPKQHMQLAKLLMFA